MLGVGRKLLLAQLEVADGVGSGRTGEEISRASVPVPAAQPVQALLFLLELREGELAERLFLVELGEVLAAVGAKLRPLLLAGLGVEPVEAGGVLGGIAAGIARAEERHAKGRSVTPKGVPARVALRINVDKPCAGARSRRCRRRRPQSAPRQTLSLIHISEPTRLGMISYAVF